MTNQTVQPKITFSPILSFAISLGIYLILLLPAFSEGNFALPKEHFYIVSLTSIFAAGVSYAVGVSGIRLRNIQVLLVSLGFISLTILFSLHGLTTPGFLIGGNRIVAIAVQLSFMFLASFLWLSTLPGDNKFIAALSNSKQKLLAGWTLFLAIGSIATIFNNALLDWLPIDLLPLNWLVASITFALSSIASFRFWKAYRFAGFPLQSALAHASILISAAQLIASTGALWHISWWLYHFILLYAVILTVIGLVRQYSFGDTFGLVMQGLFTDDPAERLNAGISPKVQALITASEAHDAYTAGHARRVALHAVRLGEEIGCSPEELRALAQGCLLHDIGKLSISDLILNKPGKLTEEERREMEKHPVIGYEICQQLGFMDNELEIIRWHHERINGRGYPDSIAGDRLSKLVRIVSVVDVYDALTSDRAYRPAMDKAAAIRHLESYIGFFLEEEYVNLWIDLVGAES